MEEERKRAELDKVAAVAALEARSREFMMEREEKKKLEVCEFKGRIHNE